MRAIPSIQSNIIKDDVYDLRALVSAHIADLRLMQFSLREGQDLLLVIIRRKHFNLFLICILTGSVNYSDSYRTKKSETLLCSLEFLPAWLMKR